MSLLEEGAGNLEGLQGCCDVMQGKKQKGESSARTLSAAIKDNKNVSMNQQHKEG